MRILLINKFSEDHMNVIHNSSRSYPASVIAITQIFRVNELSAWRMNFSRFARVPRPITEFNDTATSDAVTVAASVTYRPSQDNLPRQLALISGSAENPLEKLSVPRSRHSSPSFLPPFSHALIRGTRTEITRHDCLGIDRDLIIAPASFPSTIFSITQSSRPTAAAAAAATARWLSMALRSPQFESRGCARSRWYQFQQRNIPRTINDIYICVLIIEERWIKYNNDLMRYVVSLLAEICKIINLLILIIGSDIAFFDTVRISINVANTILDNLLLIDFYVLVIR